MKSTLARRSVTLGGRKTSVHLEDAFWKALCELAQRWHVTPSELIEEINAKRKQPNLSSAIRMFVLEAYQDQIRHSDPSKPSVRGSRMVR